MGTEKIDGNEVKGAWGLGDPKPALTSSGSVCRHGGVWILVTTEADQENHEKTT